MRCTPDSALTSSRTSQRLVNWLSVFGKNARRRITSLLTPRLDSQRGRRMVESAANMITNDPASPYALGSTF